MSKISPDTATTFSDSLHTISEACAALNIGTTKCWELINQGSLVAVRLGSRCTRIKKSSIDRLIAYGTVMGGDSE